MKITPAVPTRETKRLVLRGWRADDFPAYASLVADPVTARFITRRGQPYTEREAWAEMAFFIGHWQVLGHGMFVVEELRTRSFLGRVGTLQPPGWPGFEIAWALVPEARGRGYATEAAEAVIGWSVASLGVSRVISIIHPANRPSQRVAERLGERQTAEQFALSASPARSEGCLDPSEPALTAFGRKRSRPK